jgi:hypothetical protein
MYIRIVCGVSLVPLKWTYEFPGSLYWPKVGSWRILKNLKIFEEFQEFEEYMTNMKILEKIEIIFFLRSRRRDLEEILREYWNFGEYFKIFEEYDVLRNHKIFKEYEDFEEY